MAQYSRSLDLVTTSLRLAQKGKMIEAAKCFEHALKSKDLEKTLAALETQQVAAFAAVQKANPTLASLFTELAKGKKKDKAKAKPFGGKKAPPFGKKKSKAKASDDSAKKDDEEESGIDELDPVLDEMTADDFDGGVDVTDGDDLALEDLDGLLDGDDGVEEMPEATVSAEGDESEEESDAADGDGDSEEESADDSDDKEGEEESAPAATAKVKVVASNIAALDRLRKSKTQAGSKKPAK
jgi:hypothetical protein